MPKPDDIIVISDVDSSQYTIPEVAEPEPDLHVDLDIEVEDDKSTQEYGEGPVEGTCTCHKLILVLRESVANFLTITSRIMCVSTVTAIYCKH